MLGSSAIHWLITPFAHPDASAAREFAVAVQALIGFGTHTGTVAAASDWGGDMEVKRVRPSHADSYERICHDAALRRFLLDLRPGENPLARNRLLEPRLERFLAVKHKWDPDDRLRSAQSERLFGARS